MFYKGKKLKGYFGSPTDHHGLGPDIRKELMNRLPANDVMVLDIGTGSAGNTEFLARVLSRGSKIWTIDPSEDILAKARETLVANGLVAKVKFVKGNADKMDLQSKFFDYVISVMTLHHIGNIGSAIEEMLRVLKDHGKLLLVDYNPEATDRFKFAMKHAKTDFFSSAQVSSVLKDTGASVKAYDFDSWYLVDGAKHLQFRQ